MKHFNAIICLLLFAIVTNAQSVFINEIHYDNGGSDVDEGIEIAAPAGTDLSCYDLVFYNGNNQEQYLTENLSGTITDQSYGYGTIWFAIEGIQNGAPDGIALYDNCNSTVIQFLSYEGDFTAANDVAMGMTSTDIGVEEVASDVGTSLQLIGSGTDYSSFFWTGPITATAGNVNEDQSFGGPVTTIVSVNPTAASTNEGDGTYSFDVSVINLTSPVNVTIDILSSSTATENDDYTISATTVSFTDLALTSQTVTIDLNLIDDAEYESTETIEIEISTADATIGNANLVVSVFDNDAPAAIYTAYSIGEVTTNNADGIADSLDVNVELTGVVHGVNFFSNGISCTIIDAEGDGINVFTQDDLGYNPTEGDEITVQGSILQYNGLTEVGADAVTLNSAGNDLANTMIVNVLDESTESQLVRMELSTIPIITEAGWKGDSTSFNVKFLNANTLDTVAVRVDNETELSKMSYASLFTDGASYSITGIGGQFDNSNPYTDGYQLFPMYQSHIDIPFSIEDYANQFEIKVLQNSNRLTFTANEYITEVEILNLKGQKVIAAKSNEINSSFLNTGSYIAIITLNDTKVAKKLFVR